MNPVFATYSITSLISAAILLSFSPQLLALEVNKREHVGPSAWVRVLNVKARAYAEQGKQLEEGERMAHSCGGIDIAHLTQPTRAHRIDLTVVINGDVINAPSNLRCGR